MANEADTLWPGKTPQQALHELNLAIEAVEVRGQRYTIGDRELWRGDIRWMYPERARLEALVRKTQRGGLTIRRAIPL
jgi:hypothetical protein